MSQLWTDIKDHKIPWKTVERFCRQWIIVSFICAIALGLLGSVLRPVGWLLALWICSRQIDPVLDKSIGRKRFIASYLLAWWVNYAAVNYLPTENWDPNLRPAILALVSGITLAASHIILQDKLIRQDTGRRILLVIGYTGSIYLNLLAALASKSIDPLYPGGAALFLIFSKTIEYLIPGLPLALIQKELPQAQPVTAADQPRRFKIFLPYPWRQIVFYSLLLIGIFYLRIPLLNFEQDLFNPPYRPAPVEKGTPLPPRAEPITVQNARKVTPLAHWNNDDSSSLSAGLVRELKFSSDNRSLWVSSDPNNQIYLWSLDSGTFTATVPGYGFDISADNQYLATSIAETTTLYRAAEWKEFFSTPGSPRHFLFSPDGSMLARAGYSEKFLLLRVPDGNQIAEFPPAGSIAFNPDGSLLASGDITGLVRIWRTADLKLIHTINISPTNPQADSNSVANLAFTPQGDILASGTHDGKIHLWSVETGQLIRTFDNNHAIEEIKFNLDGTVLATLSESADLKLWNVSSGELLMEYNNKNPRFLNMDFSPDGTLIALGSWLSNDILILGIPKRD